MLCFFSAFEAFFCSYGNRWILLLLLFWFLDLGSFRRFVSVFSLSVSLLRQYSVGSASSAATVVMFIDSCFVSIVGIHANTVVSFRLQYYIITPKSNANVVNLKCGARSWFYRDVEEIRSVVSEAQTNACPYSYPPYIIRQNERLLLLLC